MLTILNNHTFRHLFAAQVTALLGTGLMTVALGLLALELAGGRAALVLGAILTIKMVAYVAVAPVAAAIAERLPRKAFLVGLDILRATVVLGLPFVTTPLQVYVLILILQSASAAFTPTFQATLPDVLPDEAEYTRALSLSRLAYDLESLLSPLLAAALLLLLPFNGLFVITVASFLVSALLVLTANVPSSQAGTQTSFIDRTTKGIRIYLATPRLRGLLGLSFAVAAGGAMVIVNTVALVKLDLGLDDSALAIALAAFGAGSMAAALALPRLLETQWNDRSVMTIGAALLCGAAILYGLSHAWFGPLWLPLLFAWGLMGIGYSAVLTPSGRLLRRSAQPDDRPAIFAAQFALSHACFLITYPLSGWLMTAFGGATAALVLGLLAVCGLAATLRMWPADDPQMLAHRHDDLPEGHPHLQDGKAHTHDFRIDGLHRSWPDAGR